MEQNIRILNEIVPSFIDYPDNESLCLCIVMMGCQHNCKGCQNPLFQNPEFSNGTRLVSVDNLIEELKTLCNRNRTNKVVLSGGDPLSVYNIAFTKEFLDKSSNIFDICIYTGYNINYVIENDVKGYKFIKCGKFKQDEYRKSDKDDEKMIFASPNQILYDGDNKPLSENGIYNFQN